MVYDGLKTTGLALDEDMIATLPPSEAGRILDRSRSFETLRTKRNGQTYGEAKAKQLELEFEASYEEETM